MGKTALTPIKRGIKYADPLSLSLFVQSMFLCSLETDGSGFNPMSLTFCVLLLPLWWINDSFKGMSVNHRIVEKFRLKTGLQINVKMSAGFYIYVH